MAAGRRLHPGRHPHRFWTVEGNAMTVSQLIELLKNAPPHATVYVDVSAFDEGDQLRDAQAYFYNMDAPAFVTIGPKARP